MSNKETSAPQTEGQKQFKFLDLAETTSKYAGRLKEAAARVIDSGRFLAGEETRLLEQELSEYIGCKYVIGVSNGLDAIRLIFRAYMELGLLKHGDEVIIPANTYIASVLPVDKLGLIPVLAPCSNDCNIDFKCLPDFVTPRTRALLLVHLFGNPSWDTDVCLQLRRRGILIIEDNAQAIGALASDEGFHGNRHTGNLGDASAISFYPTKNLGALGDAGAVMTSHPELAAAVRALANYGADRRYHNIYRGYNNRIDELQAAFLRVKLTDIEAENDLRREAAAAYSSAISNPCVEAPEILADRRQIWHQYVIRSPYRDELQEYLKEHGVGTDIHYAIPPHMQPCYDGRFTDPSLSRAKELAESILSLPIANISADDARRIAAIINEFRPS